MGSLSTVAFKRITMSASGQALETVRVVAIRLEKYKTRGVTKLPGSFICLVSYLVSQPVSQSVSQSVSE